MTQYLPDGETFPIHSLARFLGVHRTHLFNLVESGEIKHAIDLRGKGASRSTIRIPRASVIEFLERRKITPVLNGTNGHLHTRVIAGGGHSKNGRSHL